MNSEFICSLDKIVGSLRWEHFAPFVGFATAWLLFEVTERRRVRLAQRELRQALRVELETAEALVSTIVAKYARFCANESDVAFVAREIRWFVHVGTARLQNLGIFSGLPPTPAKFEAISDKQLVMHYSNINETIGIKILLPVLEQTLSGQTSGFSAAQIQSLSMVHWQAYLLGEESNNVREMFLMSFTVGVDDPRHETVLENHSQRSKAYSQRAQTLLGVIRAALQVIG